MVAETLEPERFKNIEFTYNGSITPYTRMTVRGKYVKPDAIRYLNSQNALKFALAAHKSTVAPGVDWLVPEKTTFGADMTFRVKSMHHCDLDNLVKAVMDACQKIIFKDDRYCDQIIANRVEADETGEGVDLVIYGAYDEIYEIPW